MLNGMTLPSQIAARFRALPATSRGLDTDAEKTCDKTASFRGVYAIRQIVDESGCSPPCHEQLWHQAQTGFSSPCLARSWKNPDLHNAENSLHPNARHFASQHDELTCRHRKLPRPQWGESAMAACAAIRPVRSGRARATPWTTPSSLESRSV